MPAIQRDIEKLIQHAEKLESATKKDWGPPTKVKDKFGEAGERINHIREAAKHLAAAGMTDMAEQLQKAAIQAEQDLKCAAANECRRKSRKQVTTIYGVSSVVCGSKSRSSVPRSVSSANKRNVKRYIGGQELL